MAKTPQKKIKSRKKEKLLSPIKDYFNYKVGFALSLTVLIICGAIIYWKYLSKEEVFIFEDIGSDTITVFYPNMLHGKNFKKADRPVVYSFHKGMGQSMMTGGTLLPNILRPFDWMVRRIPLPHKIPWQRLIRIIFGGLLFFFFAKSLNLKPIACVLGAALFAFCSYNIVGSTWYIHGNYIFSMMLIILGVELVLSQNKWWLLPFAVSYFVGPRLYFLTEFLIIYTIFRMLDLHNFNWRPLVKTSGNLIILGLLGVMLAGPNLGQTFTRFKYSPRVGGEVSYSDRLQDRPVFRMGTAKHNGTAIMRSFNSDLLGPGENYQGWRNYLEAPLLYCGLIILLLIPQLFFFIDRKRKILYGLFLGVWLWIIIFPWFRYAFYNFVGDYYKSALSMFIPLSFLVLGLFSLNHILKGKRPNLILLGVTTLALLGLLFLPNEAVRDFIDKSLRTQVAAFLIVYAGLLAAIQFVPKAKAIIVGLLVIVSIGEITYFSQYSNTRRTSIPIEDWNTRTRHNDYSVAAIQHIKSTEDDLFYRVDKTYGSVKSGYNDGMAQGYMGTKTYSSHNNRFQVRFMDEVGIIDGSKEYNTRWLVGLSKSPMLHPIVSTKYLLSNEKTYADVNTTMYTFVQKFNDVELYRNNYFIPMGIPYYDYTRFSDFSKLGVRAKRRAIYHTLVLEDDRVQQYQNVPLRQGKNFPGNPKTLEKMQELAGKAMNMTFFNHKQITGEIDMEQDGFVFFSIPYNENWKATVDGQPVETELAHVGFIAVPVPKGEHTIDLQYTPMLQKAGRWISIITLILIIGMLGLTRGNIPKLPLVDKILGQRKSKTPPPRQEKKKTVKVISKKKTTNKSSRKNKKT